MRIRSGTEPARSISTTGRLPARTDESSTGLRLLGGATHAQPRPGRCVLDCDPELRQTIANLIGALERPFGAGGLSQLEQILDETTDELRTIRFGLEPEVQDARQLEKHLEEPGQRLAFALVAPLCPLDQPVALPDEVMNCSESLRRIEVIVHRRQETRDELGSHSLRARIAQRSDVGGRCGRCLVAESVPSGLEKSLPPLK